MWAVGYRKDAGALHTLALHYDGVAWSVVHTIDPGRGSNLFYGVSAIGGDVWAVGSSSNAADTQIRPLVERWDGTVWSLVPVDPHAHTFSGFYAVAAVAPGSVWTSGVMGNDIYHQLTQTAHWDGNRWRFVPSPSPGLLQNYIPGLAAVSSGDIWATGWFNNSHGAPRTLTLHWDGVGWTQIPSPNDGGLDTGLTSVTAITTNDVWAVGSSSSVGLALPNAFAIHWDGASWRGEPAAAPKYSEFFGTFAVGGDVWAVGDTYSLSGTYSTLADRLCLTGGLVHSIGG